METPTDLNSVESDACEGVRWRRYVGIQHGIRGYENIQPDLDLKNAPVSGSEGSSIVFAISTKGTFTTAAPCVGGAQ